jgi:hypothetical protein
MFGTPAIAKAAAVVVPEAATTSAMISVTEKPAIVATTTLAVANPPEIKGEATKNAPALEPVVTTDELAVVKNTETVEAQSGQLQPEIVTYSKWYDQLLFGGTYYISNIYKILLALILVALIIMITIEVRRQHWRHISYGLAMLLIVSLCIIINQTFW